MINIDNQPIQLVLHDSAGVETQCQICGKDIMSTFHELVVMLDGAKLEDSFLVCDECNSKRIPKVWKI